jgi:energy-converting hydrogenase Eha subunit A
MRRAVAVGILAALVIVTVIVRVVVVPESTRLRPVRFEWAYGLHATFVLGLLALGLATRFGGRVDDLPSSSKATRSEVEALH